jgi:hypothetical protein
MPIYQLWISEKEGDPYYLDFIPLRKPEGYSCRQFYASGSDEANEVVRKYFMTEDYAKEMNLP